MKNRISTTMAVLFGVIAIVSVAECTKAYATTSCLFDTGKRAYDNEDYYFAFQFLSPCAENGDVRAQFMLSYMLHTGEGVEKDHEKSHFWLRASAMQGLPESQINLAIDYAEGYGTQKNMILASMWVYIAKHNIQKYSDIGVMSEHDLEVFKIIFEAANSILSSTPYGLREIAKKRAQECMAQFDIAEYLKACN